MAKQISVLTKAANVSEFDKVPRRLYSEDAPPLKRKFDIAEMWYIVEGELSFIEDSTKQTMTASAGDVILLPAKSIVTNMRFTQPTYIKQYIDDKDERTRISTNIRINYLIIQTILEIINQFDDFTSVPFDSKTDWIFECAKEGNLYKLTDDWHIVDLVIQNFSERTDISENVWYGKKRLNTGFRYNKPDWDSSLSIDFIEDISTGTDKQLIEAYNVINNDPLDLKSQGIIVSKDSLYTLENLLIFVARAIKEEELGLLNKTFPTDIVLRQPRNSGEYLNKNGMPPFVLYGSALATVIKHLFWANSVGFHNRLKL